MKWALSLLPALLVAQQQSPPECERFGNPSHGGCKGSWGIETVGELLYLQPFEEGLSYAIRSDVRQSAGGADGTPGGPLIDLEPRWEPGFRVSIGYVPSVTARLVWMQLNANTVNHASSQLNAGTGLQGIWMPLYDGSLLYTSARFRWKMDCNVVDVELGKRYDTSEHLSFNPSCGARLAGIDQGFEAVYETDFVHAMNDFRGLGPRVALTSDWKFAHGWRIFAQGSASMLYGRFKMHYGFVSSALPASTLLGDIDEKFNTLVPNADISIGLGWGRCFLQQRYRLQAALSYETHLFFAQNQLRQMLGSDAPALAIRQPRDLSIQGFSLRGECEF